MMASHRATFRSHERLKRSSDFQRVQRQGRRGSGQWIVWWTLHRVGEEPPRACRLGTAVGRRHGSAVARNLFKRRVRENFRLNKMSWPRGWDVVVAPRWGTVGPFPPTFDQVRADFLRLAEKAFGSQSESKS